MHKPMAIGMEQHLVLRARAASLRAPHDVLGFPPRLCCDRLSADRAEALLLLPPVALPLSRGLGGLHGCAQARLDVPFPGRVVGVRSLLHFRVALDGYTEHR